MKADSDGCVYRLEKGDVQWMTAGRGIMHSEVPKFDPDPEKVEDSEGLQLWVDLPMAQKFIEPSYQERKAVECVFIPSTLAFGRPFCL